MNMITSIELKFTGQDHYTKGGLDTMAIIGTKLNDEQFKGLAFGDVIRYLTRALHNNNADDPEKALTMLAWYCERMRK